MLEGVLDEVDEALDIDGEVLSQLPLDCEENSCFICVFECDEEDELDNGGDMVLTK